jgi:Cu/Ag efflux pump CusA
VIGMLPMAIEPGQNQPLGRAVIGGLIFATCATLFLVPSLFSLVHGRQHRDPNPTTPENERALSGEQHVIG